MPVEISKDRLQYLAVFNPMVRHIKRYVLIIATNRVPLEIYCLRFPHLS